MEVYVSNTLPPYIISNKNYYNSLVENFYTEVAKAHNKEEYKSIFAMLCNRYRVDFTNEDVQRYLLESGNMDESDMDLIKAFYVENAEPFQKVVLSAGMEVGKKYTLVYFNDIGFPVMDKITFMGVAPCQFAQYTDAVCIYFIRVKGRKQIKKYFCPSSLAVYEGWYDLEKEDVMNKVCENSNVITFRSKYCSFDARYFLDLIEKFGTPLMEFKNFRATQNGRVYA